MRLYPFITIPNIITFLRIPLALLWLYFYQNRNAQVAIILAIIFTDMIDGYLARRLHSITDFGKVFDPICDKIISLFAFFAFFFLGKISLWYLVIFLMRDIFVLIAILAYAIFFRHYNIQWRARFFGKITTALQFLAILVFSLSFEFLNLFIILIFIFSILAIIDYVLVFLRRVKNYKNNELNFDR